MKFIVTTVANKLIMNLNNNIWNEVYAMGFRYKKSLNLGGGVTLNAGKKGIGVSTGVKGFRVSHGADGKTRVTASIPGTGISYQETLGTKKESVRNKSADIETSPVASSYHFKGIVKNVVDSGERRTLSVLIGQLSTVYFNDGEIKIIADHPELGGDTNYYTLNEVEAKKTINDRGFWIFKYQEVELKITLGSRDGFHIDYYFSVTEQVADDFINWHKRALLH